MKRKDIFYPDNAADKPYLILQIGDFGMTIAIIKKGNWWNEFPDLKIDNIGSVAIEQIMSVGTNKMNYKKSHDKYYGTIEDDQYNKILDLIRKMFLGEIVTSPKGIIPIDENVEEKKEEIKNDPNPDIDISKEIMYDLLETSSTSSKENNSSTNTKKSYGWKKKSPRTEKRLFTYEETKIIAYAPHADAVKKKYNVSLALAQIMKANARKILGIASTKDNNTIEFTELFDLGFKVDEIAQTYNLNKSIVQTKFDYYTASRNTQLNNESNAMDIVKSYIDNNNIAQIFKINSMSVIEIANNFKCTISIARNIKQLIKDELNKNIIFAAGFKIDVAFAKYPFDAKGLNKYEKKIVNRLLDLQELYSVTEKYHNDISLGIISDDLKGISSEDLRDLIYVCRKKSGGLMYKNLSNEEKDFIRNSSSEEICSRFLIPVQSKNVLVNTAKKKG